MSSRVTRQSTKTTFLIKKTIKSPEISEIGEKDIGSLKLRPWRGVLVDNSAFSVDEIGAGGSGKG